MRNLRRRVDRLDRQIIALLARRLRLSREIGDTKRRHRAVVYVPAREDELLGRVRRLSRGRLPGPAAAAIFREILSGSRLAQGQAPIGLLAASEAALRPEARWRFGACDRFVIERRWTGLARGLEKGTYALALLTERDLAAALEAGGAEAFAARFAVAGDFPLPGATAGNGAAARAFVVVPRPAEAGGRVIRVLVLIGCKAARNRIKSHLLAMPGMPLDDRSLFFHPIGAEKLLARLAFSRPVAGPALARRLAAAAMPGLTLTLLGAYAPDDDHAG